MAAHGYFSLSARQRWALAELGIDAFVVRGQTMSTAAAVPPAESHAEPASEAASEAAQRQAPRVAPTAALRAALGETQGQAPAPISKTAAAEPAEPARTAQPAATAAHEALDLLSYAGSGVVIVVSAAGLPEGGERLLRDLHAAVARLGAYERADETLGKSAPNTLRFGWPNPELPDLPLTGALRGFLERQVQLARVDAAEDLPLAPPVLLSTEPAVLELALPVRAFELPPLGELLHRASAKRALWLALRAAAGAPAATADSP